MKKTKSRFLASAKLSDYLIKRVIRLYAEGVSASEAASRLRVSYPTVRNLYHLVRHRMYHLSFYPGEEEYREFKEAWNIESAEIDRHFEEITRGIWQRRGVNDATWHLHMAELLYCHEAEARFGNKFPDLHYAKIIHLIRISGPLNRPLTVGGKARAHDYLLNGIASEMRSWSAQLGDDSEEKNEPSSSRLIHLLWRLY